MGVRVGQTNFVSLVVALLLCSGPNRHQQILVYLAVSLALTETCKA